MEYNRKINLVSRNITPDGLKQLVNETLVLNDYISHNTIVDAGSGNGLLGIPLAVINQNKKIILVEPKKKKSDFLQTVKIEMDLKNIEIQPVSIEEFLKKNKIKPLSLVARGFPDLSVFCSYLKKRMIKEAIVITSENKIKKNQIHLESLRQKTYNVPLRDFLKILKITKTEKTERDTEKRM
jgi:16S rRNA (guanine527-N7)-methyltransferase